MDSRLLIFEAILLNRFLSGIFLFQWKQSKTILLDFLCSNIPYGCNYEFCLHFVYIICGHFDTCINRIESCIGLFVLYDKLVHCFMYFFSLGSCYHQCFIWTYFNVRITGNSMAEAKGKLKKNDCALCIKNKQLKKEKICKTLINHCYLVLVKNVHKTYIM